MGRKKSYRPKKHIKENPKKRQKQPSFKLQLKFIVVSLFLLYIFRLGELSEYGISCFNPLRIEWIAIAWTVGTIAYKLYLKKYTHKSDLMSLEGFLDIFLPITISSLLFRFVNAISQYTELPLLKIFFPTYLKINRF